MSEIIQKLETGKFYHIYNRGINSCDVFFEHKNYIYFLKLYKKYITPVADTFAWSLLKNHFHFMIYIKTEDEINKNQLKYSTVEKPKVIDIHYQLSHFFNSYTQAINKTYNRTGSLLEKPFSRKLVDNECYYKNLIYYINMNPVLHGIVKNIDDYYWTSYNTIISHKNTHLKREDVLNYFNKIDNFKMYHNQEQNLSNINHLVIE